MTLPVVVIVRINQKRSKCSVIIRCGRSVGQSEKKRNERKSRITFVCYAAFVSVGGLVLTRQNWTPNRSTLWRIAASMVARACHGDLNRKD